MSERESRPEVFGNGITYASPALLRILELVQASDFEELLTPEGIHNVRERFEDIAASTDIDSHPQKVFMQLCYKDPSKDQLDKDDTAWVGCEYTIWIDTEQLTDESFNMERVALRCEFSSYRIPTVEFDREPLYDPALQDHHHIVISDDEINWQALADGA